MALLQTPGYARTVYNENGNAVTIYREEVTEENLENNIKSPVTIYYKGTNNSWYAPDWFDETLWGEVKTQYDPCPYGWKVPHKGTNGSVWGTDTGTWSTDLPGYTYTNLGYWPAAGRINSSTGAYEFNSSNTEYIGFYWAGISNGEFAQHYKQIQASRTTPNSSSATGMSIRCIKE